MNERLSPRGLVVRCWLGAVLTTLAGIAATSCEMSTHDAALLIEWSMRTNAPARSDRAVADVAIFDDGRVRFGPRLADGQVRWQQLSQEVLVDLRRIIFDEQRILEIETAALKTAVRGAAARQREATASSEVVATAVPTMDAGTTVLRASVADGVHEIRYYDLAGDTQRYAEVDALQRLRRIELRILKLVVRHVTIF